MRGKSKNNSSSLNVAKSDCYKCSQCDFSSSILNDCDKHILTKHQGQALINDDRPLTKSEIKLGYRRTFDLLKILKCPKCSKVFRSHLGMVMHDEICGKSDHEKFRECEICGKRLKIHSLAIHIRSKHSTPDQTSAKEANKNGENHHDQEIPSGQRGRKRNSAIKAINKFKSIEISDDENDDNKSNKKLKNDQDFVDKSIDIDSPSDSSSHESDVNEDDLKCNDDTKKKKLPIKNVKVNHQTNQNNSNKSRKPKHLGQLLEWHQQIKLSMNSNNQIFGSMLPQYDDFEVINDHFSPQTINCPFFKSTISMETGDNQLKQLSAFESMIVDENHLIFNITKYVTAVAWCPMPFTEQSTQLNCHTQFDKIYQTEIDAKRDEYLMIATSDYDQLLRNERSDDIHLQLWNIGALNHSQTEESKPRLALIMDWTSYGDVMEMCWCPWGVTYDELEPNNDDQRLKRLGLLAVASEDGHVRILSIPHPCQMEYSYKSNYLFKARPLIVLSDRFSRYLTCNSIDWYPYEPYDMIIGAYNTGHACLWRLPLDDNKSIRNDQKILPLDQNSNVKCQPYLSIRWINERMYVCSSVNHLFIYHIDWNGLYRQMECRPCKKLLSYVPIYQTDFIQMSMIRKGSLIGFILLTVPESDSRSTIVSNTSDIFTDMTLSPWMYTVALGSESGKLCATKMLPKPGGDKKSKSIYYILHSTKLASIDQDQSNHQNEPKMKKSITLNNEYDLKYKIDDFNEKYFLLFEDFKKCSQILHENNSIDNSKPIHLLTKNDIHRYYSINKCAWSPNLSSYSWIFSTNKSGIGRLSNCPLFDPKQLY